MSTINMPGFTADHSLHRTEGYFHTGVSDTFRVSNAEVRPQSICHWDGVDVICYDEPFGGGPNFGGDKSFPKCRAGCYRTKRGAALRECLAEC